jgi:hypothetical protein
MAAGDLLRDIEDIYDDHAKKSRFGRLANKMNLMHRRVGTGYVPLLQRRWVPYFCVSAIVVIWIPAEAKVTGLYWADAKHDEVKLAVHKLYWRYTMPSEQYATLLEQLAASVPKGQRVESADCPL